MLLSFSAANAAAQDPTPSELYNWSKAMAACGAVFTVAAELAQKTGHGDDVKFYQNVSSDHRDAARILQPGGADAILKSVNDNELPMLRTLSVTSPRELLDGPYKACVGTAGISADIIAAKKRRDARGVYIQ